MGFSILYFGWSPPVLGTAILVYIAYWIANAPRRYRRHGWGQDEQARDNRFGIFGKAYPEDRLDEIHVEKVGRNDACPCGSGKKYKECCGRT